MYNFSRLRLFCAGSGLTVLLYVGKNNLPAPHHIGRCRRALPVCHPWMLPKVDHVNRWCTCFMNCNLRLGWSEEVKPVLFVVRRYV